MFRRTLITLALALVALLGTGPLVGAGVAWAHAGGLTSATSEPVVLGVEPVVPGLDVAVVEFGTRLRIANGSGQPVAVLPPPGTTVNALPVVAPAATAFWADPRIAWAAAHPRPAEGALAWRIPLRVGDTPVTVYGQQRWPPPPAAGLWWLLTGVAIAVPAALVALATRRPGLAGWRSGLVARVVLAGATVVVICAHLVHIYGSALVPAQGQVIWLFLSAAGFAVVAWPMGLIGAYTTLRGRPAGPLLCLVAGALIAVIISPADLFSFHDAVVPFAWGATLDRFLIALNVGGGLGVVAAATILMRRAPATT
ncbi:MAG: hypothetical protein ACR2G2_11610 [Pseudonocardia sp.]